MPGSSHEHGEEVSIHEILVVRALRASGTWMTHHEIRAAITTMPVAERTVRRHVQRLLGLGLVEQASVFPAHRFRWCATSEKRNQAYLQGLERATVLCQHRGLGGV